ncbi:MAG: 2-oxoglutarate dehydrogenase complex dihydrolipoyllysine-residue succinyltransferase [Pseudomonadales bacterium]|jgi:2-oxoglutarate dehydrogenase E2 component (dihydrolipoamide succinyltransferase)|nr:2-oxoglutarate dehydrogenase complex dihydrolipoyllysine-residue succinyltransferase [Pseudomonadales bacterium]
MDINAPVFPESIADGEVASWHVAVGQWVARDQILVDIETDKVVLEVVAPSAGRLTKILKAVGAVVGSEECLAKFETGENQTEGSADVAAAGQDADENQPSSASSTTSSTAAITPSASPSARKLAEESSIVLASIVGTGKNGLINKEDVLQAVARAQQIGSENPISVATNMTVSAGVDRTASGDRIERRVPMTRLRASIAKRLVEAQQNAAMLTTFNEVDMTAIMLLRKQYKEAFQKAHNGTRLGFMSFFVKACTEALKRFPGVNASIDGADVVYHGYQDVGVAVSSPRGLVVPVIRDADSLTLAEIEDQIGQYGLKANNAQLSIDEMTGGTFTISNGGVFGSMLSTPILNPPQTAILGMHKIQDRPMAIEGEVVIRPMMYLALSYDHRLIDGQEAVRFLVTVKDFLEEPARILLDI